MDVMKINILSLIANPLKEDVAGELLPVRDVEVGIKRLTKWYKGFGYQVISNAEDNYLYVDTRIINPLFEGKRGY
ncbi:MAG: hypothetical protein AB2421_08290 [Thermotaleaceae bacterium]